jgi:hypothetical protein
MHAPRPRVRNVSERDEASPGASATGFATVDLRNAPGALAPRHAGAGADIRNDFRTKKYYREIYSQNRKDVIV